MIDNIIYYKMKQNKLIASKFNSSINEWQDSIYLYNKNNLNYFIYNNNKIIFSLLDNFFNVNYNNNSLKNYQDKIKFIDNKNMLDISKFPIKKGFLNLDRFSNKVKTNKKYELEIMEKNYIYNVRRKNALIAWKNKLILNKNLNIVNKKVLSILSLKRIFVNIPNIKHSSNSIWISIHLFNKNRVYLKNKLGKLKILFKFNKSNKEILKSIKLKLLKKGLNSNILLKEQFFKKFSKNNILFLNKYLGQIISSKSLSSFFKRIYLANIYLNNYKHSYLNLINLRSIISKIFQKEVLLNITNIKYAYLENNIFVNNLTRKLNDRKKGILKVLKKSLKLIKIAEIDPIIILKSNKMTKFIINTLNIGEYINYINGYVQDKYKIMLNSIKNIHVIGISIEAKGRLTKRMTASRSVYKLKYKGNLKNIYSAYYKINTPLLRGFMKSNINLVKNNSKNKNGSYGISSSLNTF